MLNIEPLPAKIFNKAKKLGITEIHLNFSGGSDEGYLNVDTKGVYDPEFVREIEDWAWSAYGYGGAGDGSDYGDDIVYDLVKKTATASDWYMARTDGESTTETFRVTDK